MLGSIFSSSRSALSAEQMLGLANGYLNIARQTQDRHLAELSRHASLEVAADHR